MRTLASADRLRAGAGGLARQFNELESLVPTELVDQTLALLEPSNGLPGAAGTCEQRTFADLGLRPRRGRAA